MKKKITINKLATELERRVNESQTIDCCKEEIINLAKIAAEKIGHEEIEVTWVDEKKDHD